MNDLGSSKELVDQLRYVSQSANGYTELADACIAEIQRLTGMSAELLSICIQMREWLKPELVKEPDRTFFWKLNERIERFTRGRGASAEPPPALTAEEMPEPSLDVLKRVAARMRINAPDTAYLNEWAIERIEELESTFDLRWKADMRAIKRWQEAHPGNDLTWPDHADMVVWMLEQMDARPSQPRPAPLWPAPTPEQAKGNWHICFEFLKAVEDELRDKDLGDFVLEDIEAVLLAAEHCRAGTTKCTECQGYGIVRHPGGRSEPYPCPSCTPPTPACSSGGERDE